MVSSNLNSKLFRFHCVRPSRNEIKIEDYRLIDYARYLGPRYLVLTKLYFFLYQISNDVAFALIFNLECFRFIFIHFAEIQHLIPRNLSYPIKSAFDHFCHIATL